jgi:hypothetical protein
MSNNKKQIVTQKKMYRKIPLLLLLCILATQTMEHDVAQNVSKLRQTTLKREASKVASEKMAKIILPKKTKFDIPDTLNNRKQKISSNVLSTAYEKSDYYFATIRTLNNGNLEYFFIQDPHPLEPHYKNNDTPNDPKALTLGNVTFMASNNYHVMITERPNRDREYRFYQESPNTISAIIKLCGE